MAIDNQEEPKLMFFRETPKNLLNHPPLASSLQHLETSFLLIATGRYPHALIACASAIESSIKAATKKTSVDRLEFKKLINEAKEYFPLFTSISNDKIREFRNKRNEIIHFGFSPKDDEKSAILLLQTGYNLLAECYEAFFNFSLQGKDNNYGGLNPDIAYHFNVAKRIYVKAQKEKAQDLTYCFISFAHFIRYGILHWFMPDWQHILTSEDEGGWKSFEFKENQKEKLRRSLDPSWDFNCPVCDRPESFICELDDKLLEESMISLKRGVCVHCNLLIPRDCPFLADELCAEQINIMRPTILKEYGL